MPKSNSDKVTSKNRLSGLRRQAGRLASEVREWLGVQFVPEAPRAEWRALAKTFLKVGATGFGGGLAVISQIRRQVVRERRWLSDEEFLDAVSLAQSLPGANAANAISYVGLKLGGIRGALVSLGSFILPSFLIMIALTVVHGQLAEIPDGERIFQGFNAAVVGLIAATTVRLGKTALQQQWHLELGVAVAFLLIFTQTTVVEVVLLAGMTGIVVRLYTSSVRRRLRQRVHKDRQAQLRVLAAEQKARQQAAEMIDHGDRLSGEFRVETGIGRAAKGSTKESPPETPQTEEEHRQPPLPRADKRGVTSKLRSIAPLSLLPVLPMMAWPLVAKTIAVWQLATIFLRVGSITFGGGYVMIPQIEQDVCDIHRWMDHRTFADGMAFGQITPGPVLITATFIGYKVAGVVGAIVATLSAFLPSFVMTVIAGSSIDRFRTSFQVQAFLSGVAPAVVGMLAAAGVSLARSGLGSPESYGVAALSFLLMLRARLNPVLIILLCGGLQLVISRGLVSWN